MPSIVQLVVFFSSPMVSVCAAESAAPFGASHHSSTVLDAYTSPVVRRYLDRLEGALQEQGLEVPLHVMQSSGGIVTAQSARQLALQTLLSGPVGGTMKRAQTA